MSAVVGTRQYTNRAGQSVTVTIFADDRALVTWLKGTDDNDADYPFLSLETVSWVDNEEKYGWLIPVTSAENAESTCSQSPTPSDS